MSISHIAISFSAMAMKHKFGYMFFLRAMKTPAIKISESDENIGHSTIFFKNFAKHLDSTFSSTSH